MSPIETGLDVWNWPEFIAFAERLGINRDIPFIRSLTIDLEMDGLVVITQKYYSVTGEEDD